MLKNVAEASPEIARLPEGIRLPEVSFDIRMGAEVKSVDFDYAAYIEHLRDNDLFRSEIENTKIVFTTSNKKGFEGFDQEKAKELALPGSCRGVYRSDSEVIFVRTSRVPWTLPDIAGNRVNRVLVHETQHRIDYLTGVPEKIGRAKPGYNTEKLTKSERALKAALGVGVVGITSAVVAEELKIDPTLIDLFVTPPVVVTAAGSLGLYARNVIPYLRDPLEVRARQAEKDVKTEFVKIVR